MATDHGLLAAPLSRDAVQIAGAERYDVVIDGWMTFEGLARTGFPTASIMFVLATGARYRIGQAGLRNSYIMNLPVSLDRTLPMVERAGAMATPFGVDVSTTDWRPALVVSPEERAGAEQHSVGIEHDGARHWRIGGGLRHGVVRAEAGEVVARELGNAHSVRIANPE